MGKWLVGIDLGTTGAKACVFDLDGNAIGNSYKEYGLYSRGAYLEQIGSEITETVFTTCKEAIADSKIDNRDIAGVCVSTQTAVGIYLDENHEPLRDFISWQDYRGRQYADEYFSKISHEKFYELCGHPLRLVGVPAKALWVQHNQPEIWEKVRYISTPQDYILYQLGADECPVDLSSAGRNIWMNVDTMEYAPELLNAINITEDMLPPICGEAGKVVGHINEAVSGKTGLPAGCPICLGAHDQDCCTLGSGGYKGGTAIMTIGTLMTCSVISDKTFRSKDLSMICNAKQGTGNWVTELSSVATATAFKWLRDNLAKSENEAAKKEGVNGFDYLTGLIDEANPGANGVKFYGGFKTCQGTFTGITYRTGMRDMVESLLEGTVYEMKTLLDKVEKELRMDISEICLAGGIVNSPLWCQMLSNILQRKILINASKEVGCLGAAIFAAVGTGIYATPEEAVNRMVHFTKTYLPDPALKEAYQKGYEEWTKIISRIKEA